MIIVVWGVSGCGKSTVGAMLAQQLGGTFYDADDYHPQSNIQKMSQGIALNDEDRMPWLGRLAQLIAESLASGTTSVLACSALKLKYRELLRVDPALVKFVHLRGDFELIAARLAKREHEFMNNSLLQSQFDTLEEDGEYTTIDIGAEPAQICSTICSALDLR